VERAVLLGMPLPHDLKRWDTVRRVVAGRLVNGYATNDWTLGVIYRANLMTTSIAGLQPCAHQGVENVSGGRGFQKVVICFGVCGRCLTGSWSRLDSSGISLTAVPSSFS
jgi:hypothetical protein